MSFGFAALKLRSFSHLEEKGYLGIKHELHMFAIKYIYLPRINKQLYSFVAGWESQALHTESNLTPNLLWIYGKSVCKNDEIMVDLVNYEIDW